MPIPPELGDLVNLQVLYLAGNDLSGPIPPNLGDLANLGLLGLEENNLSGPIPPDLGDLTSLGWLNLSANQLTGSIPPEQSATSPPCTYRSTWIVIGFQAQSIPPELGGLTSLREIWLSENELTGCVPNPLALPDERRLTSTSSALPTLSERVAPDARYSLRRGSRPRRCLTTAG